MANYSESIESAFHALSLSTQPTEAVAQLAEASKQDVQVRERLANKDTLQHLTEVIESSLSESLATVDHALRCLGNACADNDDARDAMTEIGFAWARLCLQCKDDETKVLTTKVLYNVCSDHEKVQQRAFSDGVHYDLLSFLNSEAAIDSEESSFAIDALFLITGQKATVAPTLEEPLPEKLVPQLLRLPRVYADQSDLDNFASLVESVLAFLRDTTVQQGIVGMQALMGIWTILELVEDRGSTLDPEDETEAEDLKVLGPLCTSLIWCVSDVAARADFAQAHTGEVVRLPANEYQNGHHTPMETSGLVDRLIEHIRDHAEDEYNGDRGTDGSLYTASCEVLGNLLWGSAPEYAYLVLEEELQAPLFRRIIQTGGNAKAAAILHSTCGLLIQLSRPSIKSREAIGSHGDAMPALEILCQHEMSQIKQDSVKLLKALGKDSMANQRRFTDLAEEVLQAIRDSNDTPMAGAGAGPG